MFTRRSVVTGMAGAVMAAPLAGNSSWAARPQRRPNLLLILADDLGFADLGCYGSEIPTPHIDSLAAAGLRFTNFHTAATCSPTRAMLLTGQDNHRVGLGNMLEIMADNQFGRPGYEGYLNDRATTVATRLTAAGYTCLMAGKWHLGQRPASLPVARGFKRSVALMESGADNFQAKPYLPQNREVHWYEDSKRIDLPPDFYSSDYYTSRLIEFIDAERASGKPFFAYLPFQAVHYPHQAPTALIEKYLPAYEAGYEAVRQMRYDKLVMLGLMPAGLNFLADPSIAAWADLPADERRRRVRQMAVYAAMLDSMDSNIGRLLDYLRTTSQLDNTLILFMSDNGADAAELDRVFKDYYAKNFDLSTDRLGEPGSYSNYGSGWARASSTPLRAFKSSAYEGGMRVPLIIRPTAAMAARTTDAFGYVTDITPTLLDAAGLPAVGDLDGHSLLPLVDGRLGRIHGPDEVIAYELAGSVAVFQGDYKLTRNVPPLGDRQWQLFNLADDPTETNDLAAGMPDLLQRLQQAYADYAARVGLVEVPADYNPLVQVGRNIGRVGHDHH